MVLGKKIKINQISCDIGLRVPIHRVPMVSMFLSVAVMTSSCGGMTVLNETRGYYIYPNCGSDDDVYSFIIYQNIVVT
jgi:hypothetical protein